MVRGNFYLRDQFLNLKHLKSMIQILQLPGMDAQLYALVAPLVMDPKVLKQNYNFPFRTAGHFVWFVAVDEAQVVGFIPVECKAHECVINNYYIAGKDPEVLKLLLEAVTKTLDEDKRLLTSVTFLDDQACFEEFGFKEEKRWTRYVKMKKEK